jgi:hypothetical protein
MKELIRYCGLQLTRWLGSRIRDCDSGEVLGKAIILIVSGKVHLIGYAGPPIVPVFLPQAKMTYWVCTLGFRRWQEVDFPRMRDTQRS